MKTELKTLKDLETEGYVVEVTTEKENYEILSSRIKERGRLSVDSSILRHEAIKWAKELRKLDILYSEKTISTKELMKLASSPLGKFMIVDGVIEGEYALWSINVVDFIMHFFNLTEKDLE